MGERGAIPSLSYIGSVLGWAGQYHVLPTLMSPLYNKDVLCVVNLMFNCLLIQNKMATKYLSLKVAPKENKKKTVFTHVLYSDSFGWGIPSNQPEDFKNVLHMGVYNNTQNESMFKCWDNNPEDFTIYRGILGEEEYTSL